MKKLISLVLALMICLSVTATAFATAYTASVENKSAPAVVEIQNEEGESAIATLIGDVPEEILSLVSEEFLTVTAVADAETSVHIPDAAEEALLEVYQGLQDGTLQVPFAELDQEKADKLVVRDLFDVSWTDVEGNDYSKHLENEDISLEMTFALDVKADATVYVMVYKNDTWNEIDQVTNNGDGTVTCVFNHLCPVAVIVEAEETMEVVNLPAAQSTASAQPAEASGQNVTLWIVILAAAVVALVAVFAGKKRKQK